MLSAAPRLHVQLGAPEKSARASLTDGQHCAGLGCDLPCCSAQQSSYMKTDGNLISSETCAAEDRPNTLLLRLCASTLGYSHPRAEYSVTAVYQD